MSRQSALDDEIDVGISDVNTGSATVVFQAH